MKCPDCKSTTHDTNIQVPITLSLLVTMCIQCANNMKSHS